MEMESSNLYILLTKALLDKFKDCEFRHMCSCHN